MTLTVAWQIRPTQVARRGGFRGVKFYSVKRDLCEEARAERAVLVGGYRVGRPLNREWPYEGPGGKIQRRPSLLDAPFPHKLRVYSVAGGPKACPHASPTVTE